MRHLNYLAVVAAIQLLVGTSAFAQAPASVETVADKAAKNRVRPESIMQSCFGKQNTFGCSLRADLDPKTIGASQPASISFTRNNNGRDYAFLQAAVKLSYDLGPAFLNLKGQWHKNTEQTKEQDSQSLGIGTTFLNTNVDKVFDRYLEDQTSSTDYWTVYTDLDLSLNRKATFGDKKSASCIATPTLPSCNKQFLESARVTLVTAPFMSSFEEQTGGAGDRNYWAFGPTFGAFFESALNDDYVSANGSKVNGTVAGLTASATLSVSPGVFRNQWEFQLSAQTIQAMQRDRSRLGDFERSSNLVSASLSYALGGSFLNQKGENTWITALALKYAKGSDSLKGRPDQDSLTLGLTLKY